MSKRNPFSLDVILNLERYFADVNYLKNIAKLLEANEDDLSIVKFEIAVYKNFVPELTEKAVRIF